MERETSVRGSGYRTPPEQIDMARAERSIRLAGTVSLLALAVAVPLGYLLLPMVISFPEDLAERLGFAAKASALVLIWVVAGVGMVSTARRFSPADIGGSAAGPPSEKVALSAAFLQNTLEQAVVAAGLYFALAALISGPWLSLIPVGIVFFFVGRILFLRGYPKGVEGRSLGMSLTLMPTLLGYLLVLVLMILRWF